jgi:hypothetical protein
MRNLTFECLKVGNFKYEHFLNIQDTKHPIPWKCNSENVVFFSPSCLGCIPKIFLLKENKLLLWQGKESSYLPEIKLEKFPEQDNLFAFDDNCLFHLHQRKFQPQTPTLVDFYRLIWRCDGCEERNFENCRHNIRNNMSIPFESSIKITTEKILLNYSTTHLQFCYPFLYCLHQNAKEEKEKESLQPILTVTHVSGVQVLFQDELPTGFVTSFLCGKKRQLVMLYSDGSLCFFVSQVFYTEDRDKNE